MKQVYGVLSGKYSDDGVSAVFVSREAAERACIAFGREPEDYMVPLPIIDLSDKALDEMAGAVLDDIERDADQP